MELRYQELINDQKLSINCPPDGCQINMPINAARWVISPIEHDFNFLPNHLYNRKREVPVREMNENDRCHCCSLSFYTSVQASQTNFNGLPKSIKIKIGYTHIAIGEIEPGWGYMTDINPASHHFELYEFGGCDWLKNFQISTEL